ncbi:Outer membrane lipoprotein blc precursor [Chlamydia trachomatis]|nr:Outer membrane lipoprotein blc precursor [Chlamydia trachomatis]
MEISYFGPIFTGYNVLAIEGDYEYALVVGRNTKQCWILSRTKELPEEVRARFVTEAMKVGVRVNNLIWVDHSMEPEE